MGANKPHWAEACPFFASAVAVVMGPRRICWCCLTCDLSRSASSFSIRKGMIMMTALVEAIHMAALVKSNCNWMLLGDKGRYSSTDSLLGEPPSHGVGRGEAIPQRRGEHLLQALEPLRPRLLQLVIGHGVPVDVISSLRHYSSAPGLWG